MLGKHTIFLAIFLTAISGANAQHIYTISFEDTDDDKIGAGCTIDQRNVKRYFQRIATDLGYTPVSFDYSSENFNVQNFGSFIDKVETSPEDIILFYISSHGARSDKDKTKYPQVYLKGQMRSVYEKYEQLRKLPH